MSISPTVDKDTALARARAAIENRTKYIESLFDAAEAAATAREKVADATRAAERADADHAAAYKDALDAGWTAAELTGSGLTAPATAGKKASKAGKRAPGRSAPARRRVGAEHSPAAAQLDASPAAPSSPAA